jgi:transcriptional regulator with XRE-family HTH domain
MVVGKKVRGGSFKKATRLEAAGKNNTEPLFPNFVKEWREKKGLTQSELARAVGIAPQQINRLENHSVALTYQMATKIAPVVCQSIGQLFSEDPNRESDEAVEAAIAALTPKGKTMALAYISMLVEQGFSSKR